MAITDTVAKLSNGAEITYLDTGAPGGVTSYRTFLFIHGAAHNKYVWEPSLKTVPKGARAISFSQRGFKNSTPLTADEASCAVAPSKLHQTHISDYFAFVQFLTETLGVPKRNSDGTGGITSVHWSKGCAVATGMFYFAKQHESYKRLIDTYISSIILYEAPISAVFGLSPGDCANALFYGRLAPPPEDPGFMFAKYVTGFYKHTPEYLSNKGGPQVLEYYRTGALEPDFQKFSAKVFEGEYLPSILHWFLQDKEEDRYEACHEAFREMASSSVKKIGIIYGSEGPPEALEGSWIAERWLLEEEAKTGEKKVITMEYPGGNHYIQFYEPEGFWDAILQMSV